ncbi:MAG: RNA polymerase sigma factor [Candidatus Korobacteraceae bacterium]
MSHAQKCCDQGSIGVLDDNVHRPLISFLFRICGTQILAEELAETVLLRAIREDETIGANGHHLGLYALAIEVARSNGQQFHVNGNSNRGHKTLALGNESEDGKDQHERAEMIRKCISNLPEKQRYALLLHKYQAFSSREIAAVLGLSDAATKSLLLQGYKELQKELESEQP